ncbi:MAG: YdeI/OmpD-associated family protein [Shimia sp.]
MEFFFPFKFDAVVDRYAPMGYTVAFLPVDVIASLPEPPSSRPRVEGEMQGRPFRGGLHPTSDGRAYFILNKAFLKAAGLAMGDPLRIGFRLDDPDRVDVPPELAEALCDDEGAAEIWDGLTPGTRRGFAHRVGSARTHPTRVKRVAEVLAALEEPDPSPYPKRRKS